MKYADSYILYYIMWLQPSFNYLNTNTTFSWVKLWFKYGWIHTEVHFYIM